MGVSEIGFPQNVVYKQRIQTSDTLPVTIGASKYCEFLFDIDAGDRMTPLGIVGWGCDDKTQVFLLDFYMDNDLQTAKLILKNPYATTIAINSLYIDVLYSKQGLDMSEVDVVDNLTTDSAIAALSARQGKLLNDAIMNKHVDYYTLLYSSITPTQTTKTTEQSRSLAECNILFFVIMRGGYIRVTQIIPSTQFRNGDFIPNLAEVDSINTQRWYEVRFVSDTSVKLLSSSNATDAYIYIYGIRLV